MVDHSHTLTQPEEVEIDFLSMLEESLSVEQPVRGDIVVGTILTIDDMGLLVDLGMKRDGVVSRGDLDRLDDEVQFAVGDEVPVMIIRTEDSDGNMIVSISQAKQSEDWLRAEDLMNSGDIWEGEVADANRGGLIVPFGNLRGFIPASHVLDLPRGMGEEERTAYLNTLIGQPLTVKIIEVNRRRRRLVLSQREAQREIRDASKDELLSQLNEGDIRQGVVSGLRDFGAFVDLGGADGLIHISELAWHRVKHPREILNVGDEIDVYVLRLDQEGRRIGLSLKRLQPNPWSQVDELYYVGQLVDGTISRVTQLSAWNRASRPCCMPARLPTRPRRTRPNCCMKARRSPRASSVLSRTASGWASAFGMWITVWTSKLRHPKRTTPISHRMAKLRLAEAPLTR
jgi:small subunit ribosomal protein S1